MVHRVSLQTNPSPSSIPGLLLTNCNVPVPLDFDRRRCDPVRHVWLICIGATGPGKANAGIGLAVTVVVLPDHLIAVFFFLPLSTAAGQGGEEAAFLRGIARSITVVGVSTWFNVAWCGSRLTRRSKKATEANEPEDWPQTGQASADQSDVDFDQGPDEYHAHELRNVWRGEVKRDEDL